MGQGSSVSVGERSKDPGLKDPAAGAIRHQVIVPPELAGERLDRALPALVVDMSRTLARKVIGMGAVYIGKKRCRVSSRPVNAGDRLTATWHAHVLKPRTYKLNILHSDEHVVVLSKPAGQIVAGTELGDAGSLQLALERQFDDRTKLMHRLDMGASGLMVAARTKRATRVLTPQFREHTIGRRYLAITERSVQEGSCTFKLRKDRRRVVLAGKREGMEARTDFSLVASEGERALLEATLYTGRTHQIRVHLQGLGAPIVGDQSYGGLNADRLCLHAALLEFNHPMGGKRLSFVQPPSTDFFRAGNLNAQLIDPEKNPWLSTK
jgi:23S rRNA pseudouridine1911/1915/1917 synthase